MVRRSRRNRVRNATLGSDILKSPLPARLDADVEAGLDEFDLSPHDARQQDVPDPVVDRIGPVNPALLDEPGRQAEPGRDGGYLSGVVGLHPADGDQVRRAHCEGIGYQVLQLADLVPSVRQSGVAVLPFGPYRRPAKVPRKPLKGVYRARSEHKRISREIANGHAVLLSLLRRFEQRGQGLPVRTGGQRRLIRVARSAQPDDLVVQRHGAAAGQGRESQPLHPPQHRRHLL
jgi:hypothetical protein